MPNDMKKILVVEDEKPMAKAIGFKLKKAGFDATVVFNGVEALDKLKNMDFDVIITDLMMPNMDGFDFIKKLKNSGNNTPIIVTSNLSSDADEKKAKDLGAKEYFVKSDTPIFELIKYVEKMLGA